MILRWIYFQNVYEKSINACVWFLENSPWMVVDITRTITGTAIQQKKHNQWKHTKPQNKPHSITPYNTAIQHKQHITSRTHTHQHLLTKPPPRGLPHPLGVQAKGIQRHHNGAWAAVGRVILGVELLRQLEEVAQPWGGEDLSQHKIHRALIYLLKLYSSH